MAEEDYDTAKSLKLEMEKLRESFNNDQSTLQSLSNSVKQVTISNRSDVADQNPASHGHDSAGSGIFCRGERRDSHRYAVA